VTWQPRRLFASTPQAKPHSHPLPLCFPAPYTIQTESSKHKTKTTTSQPSNTMSAMEIDDEQQQQQPPSATKQQRDGGGGGSSTSTSTGMSTRRRPSPPKQGGQGAAAPAEAEVNGGGKSGPGPPPAAALPQTISPPPPELIDPEPLPPPRMDDCVKRTLEVISQGRLHAVECLVSLAGTQAVYALIRTLRPAIYGKVSCGGVAFVLTLFRSLSLGVVDSSRSLSFYPLFASWGVYVLIRTDQRCMYGKVNS